MWFVVYTLDVQLDKLDDGLLIDRGKRVYVCTRRALNTSNI